MTDADDGLFPEGDHIISGQDPRAFDTGDLSPEKVADHLSRATASVLESTGLIEIKEISSSVGQCHFFGRVKDDDKKRWAALKKNILVVMRFECDGFMGTQDILELKPGASEDSRNPDDYNHKFGHLVSIGAKDLKHAVEEVCKMVIDNTPRNHAEVMEAPMAGAGSPQSGGPKTGRKGAHPTSTGAR